MKYTLTLFLTFILFISFGQNAFQKGGLFGFKGENGNVIMKPQYQYAFDFSEGLALVQEDDQWGFIDADNKVVVPIEYDQATEVKEGIAKLYKDGKYGMINSTGKIIVPVECTKVYNTRGNLIGVEKSGKEGIYKKNGEVLIPVKYDEIYIDSDYRTREIIYFECERDKTFDIYRANGEIFLSDLKEDPKELGDSLFFYTKGDGYGLATFDDPNFVEPTTDFDEAYLPYRHEDPYNLKKDGELVALLTTTKPYYFVDNVENYTLPDDDRPFLVVTQQNKKYLYNLNLEKLTDQPIEKVITEGAFFEDSERDLSLSLYKIEDSLILYQNKDSLYGIISADGRNVVKPEYQKIYVSNGLFIVQEKNQVDFYFINQAELKFDRFEHYEYSEYNRDLDQSIDKHFFKLEKDGKVGFYKLVDLTLVELLPIEYEIEGKYLYAPPIFSLKKNGKKKLYELEDPMVSLDWEYEEIKYLRNFDFTISNGKKWALANLTSGVLTPFEYDEPLEYFKLPEWAYYNNIYRSKKDGFFYCINNKGIDTPVPDPRENLFYYEKNIVKTDNYSELNEEERTMVVIPDIYKKVEPVMIAAEFDLFKVKGKNGWGLVDMFNDTILELNHKEIMLENDYIGNESHFWVTTKDKKKGLYSVYDRKFVIKPKYEELIFNEELNWLANTHLEWEKTFVLTKSKTGYGVIDVNSGKTVLEPFYDELIVDEDIDLDVNGIILKKDDKTGYYNVGNHSMINAGCSKFYKISGYNSDGDFRGYFMCVYNDTVKLIDAKSTESYVLDYQFDELVDREECILNYIVKKGDKYGLINSGFELVVPIKYENAEVYRIDEFYLFYTDKRKVKIWDTIMKEFMEDGKEYDRKEVEEILESEK